jgi:hypothetical protein
VEVRDTGERKSVNTAVVTEFSKIDSSISEIVPSLVVSIPRHLHDEPECIEAKEK